MKKIFLILLSVIFTCGLVGTANIARADISPPTPAYLNTKLNVQVGLSDLRDRFVIIRNFSRYGEVYDEFGDDFVTTTSYYGSLTYFALEKDFFESNGGMDGLFQTTGQDESTTTTPKDAEKLEANSYHFVIKSDDVLLEYLFNHSAITSSEAFVDFPFNADYYIRQGVDDLDCETGFQGNRNCILGEETLTYIPSEISDHQILLVNAAGENQEVVSASEEASNSIPEVIAEVVSEPAPQLHWWQRLWNFIKSLF